MRLTIIFGKDERKKVEVIRNGLSSQTVRLYDEAETYRDGKWAMFDTTVPSGDIKVLLAIKRSQIKRSGR